MGRSPFGNIIVLLDASGTNGIPVIFLLLHFWTFLYIVVFGKNYLGHSLISPNLIHHVLHGLSFNSFQLMFSLY